VSVSEGAIVVSVDENASATAAGDSILIESADGDGIRFDTSDAADGDAAAFSIQTNAGDAPVVQSTGAVAAVGERPDNGSEDGSDKEGDDDEDDEEDVDEDDEIDEDEGDERDNETVGSGPGGGSGSGAGSGNNPDTDDGTSQNETSAESANESSVEPPAGAVAFDAQQIADTAPGQEGVRVDFENVSVDSITFVAGADGQATIAQMDELPDDVPGTPGELLMAMEISVPENISDEQATIRFTLDESQLDAAGESPESIRLGHYTDGGWETSQPELVGSEGGEYVYESEVPGFSLYAVYAEESTEQTDSETTATATEDEPVGERAGLIDSPITAAFGFVGLLALVLTIAGARMYQQNDSL
jgi:PGF-pre-PGF domain-containing protein